MPELPEVQTVVDQLQARLNGRSFMEGAAFLWPGSAGYPDAAAFVERIARRQVAGVHRRAKYILAELDHDGLLVIHLRMTGNLHFADAGDPYHPYLRVRLPLDDGGELRFADMRKFGRMYVGSQDELAAVIPLNRLGPEPLDPGFTAGLLQGQLARRHGAIKAALLDQAVLAGLGNIYADEALFRAGIDPRRPADSLTASDVAALHGGIRTSLQEALYRGGTSFRDFLNMSGRKGDNKENLQVFRRHGEPCPRCAQPLCRIVVAGRGTHFCPNCQV